MRSAIYKLRKMIDCAQHLHVRTTTVEAIALSRNCRPPHPHTRKVCFLDARSLHTRARMRIVCVCVCVCGGGGGGGEGSNFMTGAAFYMNVSRSATALQDYLYALEFNTTVVLDDGEYRCYYRISSGPPCDISNEVDNGVFNEKHHSSLRRRRKSVSVQFSAKCSHGAERMHGIH